MFKIAMDATYLEALIKKDHPKHEIADKMVRVIFDDYRICIPNEEYAKVFDIFQECDMQIKEKIQKTLIENVTLFSPTKQNIIDALNSFQTYGDKLSYYDCCLLESFKERGIRHIISLYDK